MKKSNKLFFKISFFLILFSIFILFYSCLYYVEKTNLELNDYDSILNKLQNNRNSFIYPDKELIRLLEAVILERKSDYNNAYNIYSELNDSEYQIYARNRKEIIEKYYLKPIEQKAKTQNETTESAISIYEKDIINFLSNEKVKVFFDEFYKIIFPFNLHSSEISNDNTNTDSTEFNNNDTNEDGTNQISNGETSENNKLIENILQKQNIIKSDIEIQNSIKNLLIKSEQLLKDKSLPYMTQSKIYFYNFFFYLLSNKTDIQSENNQINPIDYLYKSFYYGGLYYYQLISYCIINRFSQDSNLNKAFNIYANKINLENFFDFSKDANDEFSNIKKDKKEIRNKLKNIYNRSNLKQTDFTKKQLKKHLFLASYFIENDLFLEFSRAIFYLRDLTTNYKIYNSLLIDFYNFTDQYDKAIYYQWDDILSNYFPLSMTNKNKISNSELSVIFPLWFIDIIKDTIEKMKSQSESELNKILIDPYFYLSIINAESSFSKTIISTANAVGLMQILPSTAAWLRKTNTLEARENLFDPVYNIESGFLYIMYLYKTFNGNIISIIGAYNGGHNAFAKKKVLNIHPLLVAELYPVSQTAIYIKKIIRNYLFYKYIYVKKDFDTTLNEIVMNSLR